MRGLFASVFSLLVLVGCRAKTPTPTPTFHAKNNPQSLSEWGVISAENNQLILGEAVIAYDLITPLFSDYAHKLRTVWMPGGTAANYHETDTFDFPVGTIISKTFYYPGSGDTVLKSDDGNPVQSLANIRVIETRILVHRENGWDALPYVWNDAQTEASLKRIGAILPLTLNDGDTQTPFNYVVPNQNQCAGCHAFNNTTRELLPIGPKARHLNKPYPGEVKNQLAVWTEAGYLKGIPETETVPKAANWLDEKLSLNARGRSYLDINCAHCHNTKGPADTSGLHYEPSTEMGSHLGRCKTPVAAGGGTGDRPFDLVPGAPEDSIMLYRMETTDPGQMMPELGRSLKHDEGVELLKKWIAGMDGGCG